MIILVIFCHFSINVWATMTKLVYQALTYPHFDRANRDENGGEG